MNKAANVLTSWLHGIKHCISFLSTYYQLFRSACIFHCINNWDGSVGTYGHCLVAKNYSSIIPLQMQCDLTPRTFHRIRPLNYTGWKARGNIIWTLTHTCLHKHMIKLNFKLCYYFNLNSPILWNIQTFLWLHFDDCPPITWYCSE